MYYWDGYYVEELDQMPINGTLVMCQYLLTPFFENLYIVSSLEEGGGTCYVTTLSGNQS